MSPDVIVENNVIWTDVAIVILTSVLVIGAFFAAWQVHGQIRQTQRHHDEQLRALLRPLVVAPHAESLVVRQEQRLEFAFWVQNVGPGPAMNIDIRVWPRVPKTGWDKPEERIQEIESLKSRVDVDMPEYSARLAALAPVSKPSSCILVPAKPVMPEDYAAQRGVLIYTVYYDDVFENRFPRKQKRELKLGHIEVSPKGSWNQE